MATNPLNEHPFTTLDAIRAIRRRKISITVFFLVTCFLIGFATLLSPKTYTSEARLFMRLGRENTSLDATATLGEHPVVMLPQSREDEINSIVEMLQSKQLYEQIVEEIDAERILNRKWRPSTEGGPEEPSLVSNLIGSAFDMLTTVGIRADIPRKERAVIKLQKNTEIEAFEKSNVITISFESYSPELAQLVVDKLVSLYQTKHVQLHRPQNAYSFLQLETDRIEEQLNQALIELETFKNKTGILESEKQRSVLIERMAQLQSDLLLSESTEAALATEVRELEIGLSNLSESETVAETVGAGNEGADGMRQELYRLEVLRSQYASKYTPRHPQMKKIDQQVDEAKSILDIAESGRKESVVGPNKVFQETAVAIEQRKPQLAAQQAKTKTLKQQISDIQEKLAEFNSNERDFARLDRNVEILEANYKRSFANSEHARIDAKMRSEELSNIGIAQPATLNPKPSSPIIILNFLAAIVLGIAGGLAYAVFAEYMNPYQDENTEPQLGTQVSVRQETFTHTSADYRVDGVSQLGRARLSTLATRMTYANRTIASSQDQVS